MRTATPAAPMTHAETLALVLLLLAQFGLFLIPLVVLGQAIGWPASLRLPASEALPLIAQNGTALQIGYWGYLLTATAMVPLALALRRFAQSRGAGGLLVDAMAALGVAAAVLKTLGIIRWLIAMPALAGLYAGTGDPATRVAIEVSYLALNGYAGAVGELLGVQLFSGLWLLLLGLVLGRMGFRRNGVAALAIGAGFAITALRSLIPPLAMLQAFLPPVGLMWFLVMAATVWRAR
jgi:hypothetical protein